MPEADRNGRPRPRRQATQRSTSGSGFEFEDLVAAWFLTKALVGEPAPGLSAAPRSLHFQTRPSGWLVDDLLVTTTDGARMALSCKSSVQVSRNGLPKEFADDVRGQWAERGPFDAARDKLMLVTQGAHPVFATAWRSLKAWGRSSDDNFVLQRIAAEARPAKVFESLSLKGETNTPVDQLAILRRTEYLQLDLQDEHSAERDAAVGRCRAALVDGDQTGAEGLWRIFVDLAKEARLGDGTLIVSDVWARVRQQVRLRDHPDFAAAWTVLDAITLDHRSRVQTTLPLGLVLPREELRQSMSDALDVGSPLLVFGESGAGKSALVKAFLDADRPDWRQVWLGPEALPDLLSEERRVQRGVAIPLADVLGRSSAAQNVLVIDSAERLEAGFLPAIKGLIETLRPWGSDWRVVVITQPDNLAAWADSRPAGTAQPIEVGLLSAHEVRAALYSRPELAALAADPALLEVLGNPRTLGWVIQAGAGLNAGDLVSHTAVADRLWDYWTERKPVIQGFIIRLARREADFERSFGLSQLDANDLAALQSKPQQFPLRQGLDKRLSFEHDLVADWARFQALKEDAESLPAWLPLTAHPLWITGLRLMAQHLLRLPGVGGTAWDRLLIEAETAGESLAADVLLEALALDPQADRFLAERADFLLADEGKRLERLLHRFHHLATVPAPLVEGVDANLRLYLESKFRTPIVGRWGPVARFLARNADAVSALMSPTVSMICATWLSGTPTHWREGEAFPLRRELAQLALATAREVQVAKTSNVIILGEGAKPVFAAALKAAEDIPDLVGAWALEMAERRPADPWVIAKACDNRRRRQEAIEARMLVDETFRTTELERRQHRPSLAAILEPDLPPWPLGALGRVDHDFRRVCLHEAGLLGLMRIRPDVASEVLLALIIEDQPKERMDQSMATDRWGLEYDSADGPMAAPFRSPFFAFLRIDAQVALSALEALIGFCTERWADDEHRFHGTRSEPLRIPWGSSEVRQYVGDFQVFDWGGSPHLGSAQLHSMLAALEKWLCNEIDAGQDIAPVLDRLLADGRSAAFVGVAVNVGKYRPDLFGGPLRPLIGMDVLYFWDAHRSASGALQFDPLAWWRYGQAAHDAARDWAFAEYRKTPLKDVVEGVLKNDPGVAQWLKTRVLTWDRPVEEPAALEHELLCARLDRSNYRPGDGGDLVFDLPFGLRDRLESYNAGVEGTRQLAFLAPQLADALKEGRPITEDSAVWVASMLDAVDVSDTDPSKRRTNILACAATLVALAPEWLGERSDLEQRCLEALRTAAENVSTEWEVMGASGYDNNLALELTAWGICRRWATDPLDETWHKSLLALLLSGSGQAAGIVVAFAHAFREPLGSVWQRLLQIILFRVALGALAPGHRQNGPSAALWAKRMTWLRTRSLGAPTQPADLDLLKLQSRVARLRAIRRRRLPSEERAWRAGEPVRPPAFNDHLLELYFGWLVRSGESDDEVRLLEQFWAYALDRQRRRRDDDREDAYPEQFEMHVIERLAMLSVRRPDGERLWRSVLAAGPLGHQAVGRFASHLFFQIEELDRDRFLSVWRGMISFGLSDLEWAEAGRWYYRQGLLRQLLGLELPGQIARLADVDAAVGGMADLYRTWATRHLPGDEDSVAAFARFLNSAAGAALRPEGLLWLAAAAQSTRGLGYWRRDNPTAEAIVDLVDAVLRDEAGSLGRDKTRRDAVMTLVAELVKRQIAMGLVLQERLRAIG